MEYEIVYGKYKRWDTKYYACFAEGKVLASTRKRDLPRVDTDFRIGGRGIRRLVVGCPKHGRAEVEYIGVSPFYLDAAKKAGDCEEYHSLVKLFQAWQKAGWAALRGEKLDRLPQNIAVLKALRALPEETLAAVLTERARVELTARLLKGT
jgi:hypothetical protein